MNCRFLPKFLLIVFSFVAISCSEDYTVLESIESISLSTSASSKTIGETMEFTVLTNSGQDVTASATFYIDDVIIDGNTFSSNTIGTYTVKASYFGVNSESISLNFHDGSEINFIKRVLIEDYTGTWCGYCPRVAFAIERVAEQTAYAVPVAIHRSSSNPADANYDPYNYDTSELELLPQIPAGYPKGLLNRVIRWTPLEQNNIPQALALTQGENPKLGLAMNASFDNGTINLEVKTKFSNSFQNLKLVVYVLENDLFHNQVNYTSNLYGTGNISPLVNFEHNHVLRFCATNLMGDAIPNSESSVGLTYTKQLSFQMPSNISNPANIEFAAFIVDDTNKALNVRKAYPGDSQEFEEF
uniref:Omp28-related outer membrane protein n=1 Tax=Flavobacterium sp. TaxID=239 RepID=UPI00404B1796